MAVVQRQLEKSLAVACYGDQGVPLCDFRGRFQVFVQLKVPGRGMRALVAAMVQDRSGGTYQLLIKFEVGCSTQRYHTGVSPCVHCEALSSKDGIQISPLLIGTDRALSSLSDQSSNIILEVNGPGIYHTW